MPRRLLVALVALVVLVVAGGGTATGLLQREDPAPKRYGDAPSVVAAMQDGGRDCRLLPSAGEQGGAAYARCEVSPGNELAVWTGPFPVQPHVLEGPGWRVHGSRAGLQVAQDALAGELRETPVAVRYGIRCTGGPLAYDDAQAKADLRPCLDLPGAKLETEAQSLPPILGVRLEGTEAERARLDRCLRSLPTSTKAVGPTRADGGWTTTAMQDRPEVSGPFVVGSAG